MRGEAQLSRASGGECSWAAGGGRHQGWLVAEYVGSG